MLPEHALPRAPSCGLVVFLILKAALLPCALGLFMQTHSCGEILAGGHALRSVAALGSGVPSMWQHCRLWFGSGVQLLEVWI